MKRNTILICCVLLCLILLGGCACEHTWLDADCITAKTCASCGETEGEPLGHTWVDADCDNAKTCSTCGATEGEPLGHTWLDADCITAKTCSVCGGTEGEPLGHTIIQRRENPDVIAGTATRIEYCTVCNERISSETVPLSPMTLDDAFLFTPNEFMERFAVFTDKYVHSFQCEFVLTDVGLAAFVHTEEKQVILQFFKRDGVPMTAAELDSAEVWCVSLAEMGEKDPKLRQCFLMACDPALDKDTAYRVNVGLTASFQSAAYAGELFGYLKYNDLLYETTCIYGDLYDEEFSMEMVNVYASDFREKKEEGTIVHLGA